LAIAGHFQKYAEDDSKDDHAEERVQHCPSEAENRLFIENGNITENQEVEQVAVFETFAPVKKLPVGLWFNSDNRRPGTLNARFRRGLSLSRLLYRLCFSHES